MPPTKSTDPGGQAPVSPSRPPASTARIEQENQELRLLLDLIPQLVYVKDAESRMLYANRAQVVALTRDSEADIRGRTDRDFYAEELATKFREDERRVIESGRPIINEIERGRDPVTGDDTWMMTTKVPIRDAEGTVTGIVGIGADVTRQRATEQRARLQAAALNAAANSIVITDANGTIVWVNDAFTRLLGYTRDEVVGANPRVLKSGMHAAEFYQTLWETILGGKVWSGEIVNRHKDGSLVYEETTISPVRDEGGCLTHFVAIKQDLSHRRELEAENRRIGAAIEWADDAIVLADLSGHVTYANRSFFNLFRRPAAAVLHQPLTHLFRPEVGNLPLNAHTLETILQHGWEEELEVDNGDGQSLLVRLRVSQVRGEDGKMEGFACYLYDLSEEKRRAEERALMEVRLRQAQKLESIGQLAAGVAHEINTPTQFVGDNLHFLGDCLTDLMGIVSTLHEGLEAAPDGPVDPALCERLRELVEEADLDYLREELPAALKQASEGVQRIAEIVKAMKEFSHPGTKDRKLANLNDALQKAATVARNEWKYHAEVTFDLDPELTPILCLPGEVNQVFLNIIVNAAHAVKDAVESGRRERGLITISTRQKGETVEIRIGDNGTGIPAAIVDRIYDPFFTTKEVGKGTGQGLAIAYDVIAHKHKGELFCESREGEGTTFVIRLPRGKTH